MTMATPAPPKELFVCPGDIDWKNPGHYPAIDHGDNQHWAWEFLRRSASYTAAHAALPAEGSNEETFRKELGHNDIDFFCLAWHIKKPLAPSVNWSDIDLATQLNLIRPPRVKAFHPARRLSQDEHDREPVIKVTVPATPRQLIVRISLEGDPATQVKEVAQLLEEARRRVDVRLQDGTIAQASFHDRSSPLRAERVEPLIVTRKDGSAPPVVRSLVTYRQLITRTPRTYLHFILRTLDAICHEANPLRDQITQDETFFSMNDRKNREAQRAWLMNYPFGKDCEYWVEPLAKKLAAAFRTEFKRSDYPADLGTRFTPKVVRSWMRYARRCVLEQGYVQIAVSEATADD